MLAEVTGEEWQAISPPWEGHPCCCVVRDNEFKGRPKVKQETCVCVDAVLIKVPHTNKSPAGGRTPQLYKTERFLNYISNTEIWNHTKKMALPIYP